MLAKYVGKRVVEVVASLDTEEDVMNPEQGGHVREEDVQRKEEMGK